MMMVFEGTGLKGRQEGAFPRKQLPSILIFLTHSSQASVKYGAEDSVYFQALTKNLIKHKISVPVITATFRHKPHRDKSYKECLMRRI